jgi:hypothetical protein
MAIAALVMRGQNGLKLRLEIGVISFARPAEEFQLMKRNRRSRREHTTRDFVRLVEQRLYGQTRKKLFGTIAANCSAATVGRQHSLDLGKTMLKSFWLIVWNAVERHCGMNRSMRFIPRYIVPVAHELSRSPSSVGLRRHR